MRAVLTMTLVVMVVAVAGCFPVRWSVRDDGVAAIPCGQQVIIYEPRKEKVEVITPPDSTGRVILSVEWSPDGKRLLVVDTDIKGGNGEERCRIVSADGKDVKEVAKGASFAHWTPDAEGVTFLIKNEAGDPVLNLMDVETGKTETLLDKTLPFYAVKPESEQLAAFQAAGDIEAGVAILYLVKSEKEKEPIAAVRYVNFPWVTWSRDGKKLLFTTLETKLPEDLAGLDNEAKTKPSRKVALYAIDTDSGKMSRLTRRNIGYGEYSPDGKHILFVELRGLDETNVGVMRSDGSGVRMLDDGKTLGSSDGPFGAANCQPVWLSNTRVQYYKDRDKNAKDSPDPAWWAIDIDGKNKEDLGAKIMKLIEALPKEKEAGAAAVK